MLGSDCRNVLRGLFRKNEWGRVLLITGKRSFVESGACDLVDEVIPVSKDGIIRFSDFDNNPNIKDLRKGIACAEEFHPSVIIAIGGGSVIDMGKLIRFFYTHEGEILGGKYVGKDMDVPLIAIPTTAGTGSEATHFAVLYDEQRVKHSLADKDILPEHAFIYPELTYNQSSYLTACAGFDALAQGIEAYWNRNATPESDKYAIKAIDLIYDTLPEVVKNPTPELRGKMAEGAYWAGRAINITKTTAPHAFSYPFTAHYGIPHGHAVAIVFPVIAEMNMLSGNIPEDKVRYLFRLFKVQEERNFDVLITYINALGLSLPKNNYNFRLLEEGVNFNRLANNPKLIDKTTVGLVISRAINNI